MALRANSHRPMDTPGRDMMKYMMKMWASNAVYWRHFPILTAKEDEEGAWPDLMTSYLMERIMATGRNCGKA